jgi:flagellar basal body-associated protein FliL
MANAEDADDIEQPQAANQAQEQQGSKTKQNTKTDPEKASNLSMITKMVVAIIICSAAGVGLGQFAAGYHLHRLEQRSKENAPQKGESQIFDVSADRKGWYYALEPVEANLDKPDKRGMKYFVRARLTLEVGPGTDPKKAADLLDLKKTLMENWLITYLSGLAIEEIKGGKNLKCIQTRILEAFNEILFPDSKPQVAHILFNEFVIYKKSLKYEKELPI